MKRIIFLLYIVLGTSNFQGFSQHSLSFKTIKPYKWMIGIGWNVVDDDGRAFSYMLDVKNSWNYLYYPTTLSVDRYLKRGFSVEFVGAYNKYGANKCVNGQMNRPGTFVSLDLQGKYSFSEMLSESKWFDPYVCIGLGITYRDNYATQIVPTTNLALGANFWYKNAGLRLQTSGKLGLSGAIWTSDADYVHHSISLLYRFGSKSKRNEFSKPKHKWIHQKERYRGRSK